MTSFVALLRAVNVGGTSKLAMRDLVALAEHAGLHNARTYIASGNLLFESASSASKVKRLLEDALREHMGKPVGVMIRTAAELADILARNPFPDAAPNQTAVIFLDHAPPATVLKQVVAPDGAEVRLGTRELYVHYPRGMGRSRLKLPAADGGTARNINTVARLAGLTIR